MNQKTGMYPLIVQCVHPCFVFLVSLLNLWWQIGGKLAEPNEKLHKKSLISASIGKLPPHAP